MRTANHQALTRARQHGAALLVMLVLLITGGAYLLVSQLNRASSRSEADRQTSEALAQAKEALIGWAVGNMTTPGAPGMLPYPDRRDDSEYDGLSDCPAVGTPTSAILLLGKTPQIGPASPCPVPYTALGLNIIDAAGEVLWYAVSRNMVSALGVAPVINPDIMNNPPFPWLVVRDQAGNIINDRIAFLLIAPGPALPGQNRFVPPLPTLPPSAAQFLEGIGLVSNTDFNGTYDTGAPCLPGTPPTPMCEDFVMSEPWPSATAPTFNDRLLYVTIDELMPLIEQRVAREVRQALNGSADSNGGLFPVPTAVGYMGNSCTAGSTEGFLPISACECRRTVAGLGDDVLCNCHFEATASPLASITYTGVGNYTAAVGNCSAPPSLPSPSCQCTGEGSCSAGPARIFQCNANGVCTARNSAAPISYSISYSLPASVIGGFSSVTRTPVLPNCTITPVTPGPTMRCNNFAQVQGIIGVCSQLLTGFPVAGIPGLPGWFFSNGWKQFMYYAVAPPVLTVGSTGGITAVVISTGRPLTGQARPSSLPGNYLESPNGVAPAAFAGAGQSLTNTFNDQTVIAAP